jgi:hypothetical protein
VFGCQVLQVVGPLRSLELAKVTLEKNHHYNNEEGLHLLTPKNNYQKISKFIVKTLKFIYSTSVLFHLQ